MTNTVPIPNIPRPTLARFIEKHRKTILPTEVVKVFREADVELDRLLTIVGNNNSAKMKVARRAQLHRAMENPISPEATALFESARRRDEDGRETANAAKVAASRIFAEKVAPRLAETFERVAALLRAEAQVETDAMKERAARWDVAAFVTCPIAAFLRIEAATMDVQSAYSRKVADGREIIPVPPKPSDVLKPVLGIVL